METHATVETTMGMGNELEQTKNKVIELEKKVALLEEKIKEKDDVIFNIQFKLEDSTAWVENWKDSDGDEFTGSIYWTKRNGSSRQGYSTYFNGEWDLQGNIVEGELTDNGEVIEKWEDGQLIEEEKDSDEESDEDEDEDEEEDSD